MGTEVKNHCANCSKEIAPEEEFCAECIEQHLLVECPLCGKIVCECETGIGD